MVNGGNKFKIYQCSESMQTNQNLQLKDKRFLDWIFKKSYKKFIINTPKTSGHRMSEVKEEKIIHI